MEGVLCARARPPARRAQVQGLRAHALPAHARLPLVHGPRVDVAGGVRARDDLLLRDRRPCDPARLQGDDSLRRRAGRAGRAARSADARRSVAGHRQPREGGLHGRVGGGRRDRQTRPCRLPGPRRPHGAAPVHAGRGARGGSRVEAPGVKFGLGLSVQHLPEEPQAARFREHIEQVRLARAVGFSSIWASQHYLSDPFTYFQPIPTLARLAADARGMTLGTGVLLLPLHHPVEIAEQLATLDVITDGHLIFGVGLGYRDVENVAMGHDPKERVGRLIEGLEIVERLWSGEPGRPAAIETPLIKECYVAPEAATALTEAPTVLGAKYQAYRRWEQDKALPAGETFDASFDELARDRFIIGDPARVVDEIARYRERLGVTTMIFRLQWPGMDQEKVLRSIRLLGHKVLLKFLSA